MTAEESPRQRRSAQTRQTIVHAAREIVMNEGVDALSMRGLAEKVDYSPSALYKYFDSKHEILRAIRDESMSQMDAFMPAEDAPGMPPEILLAAGRRYLKFAFAYPDLYQLLFNTAGVYERSVGSIESDPSFGGLAQLVQVGVDSGHFQLPEGYTPIMMAFQIWITIHGMSMLGLTVLSDGESGFQDLCNQLMELFVNNISAKDME